MRSAQVRCPSEKFSNHAVSLSGLGDSAWILYLGELIVLEAEMDSCSCSQCHAALCERKQALALIE